MATTITSAASDSNLPLAARDTKVGYREMFKTLQSPLSAHSSH
ncbi:hypothetical protein QEZ52_09615 [Aliisedimentitalea scapharcae]|uniref:Uncharacterized protein n=1 Tax=Aliisedimentitalea scapharcae TaxID=1524259 RepID=A0ABZ2XXE9_9RHOB